MDSNPGHWKLEVTLLPTVPQTLANVFIKAARLLHLFKTIFVPRIGNTCLKGGQFFERPATLCAGVRLVVGVVQHVLVKRLLERERLAADVARVRSFTCKTKTPFLY